MLYSFWPAARHCFHWSLQQIEWTAEVHVVARNKSTWLGCNWIKKQWDQDRTINMNNRLQCGACWSSSCLTSCLRGFSLLFYPVPQRINLRSIEPASGAPS
jgi:hypothetical protein